MDTNEELAVDVFADVREFHAKFNRGYDGPPRALPEELSDFRIEFMMEELHEYMEAVENGNLEAQFDALLDLIYVASGTLDLHGFPAAQGWLAVQRANMSKEPGHPLNPGKRGSPELDVVKPPGWTPPNLKGLIEEAQLQHQLQQRLLP